MSGGTNKRYQSFLDAIKHYDISKAVANLEFLSTEDIKKAIDIQLSRPGAFQILGDRSKRDDFYKKLLTAPALIYRHADAQAFALGLHSKIMKIERCFDQIRASLPECDISKYPEDVQFWSHIERATQELQYLQKKLDSIGEEFFKSRAPVLIPQVIIIEGPSGEKIDADSAFHCVIENLSLSLKMLSYEYNLYVNEKVVGPQKPEITDEHIYKSGPIQLLASSWSALEDIANRTLLFGGEISSFDDIGISPERSHEAFFKKFKDGSVFNRGVTEREVFDLIANRRLHAFLLQSAFFSSRDNLCGIVMAEGEKVPNLLVRRFISIDEALALEALQEILSYDIVEDNERYHGLTMREWVRGYSSLKFMAMSKPDDSCWLTFEKPELEQHFREFELPKSCIPALIGHLTFGKDSRDLWDSPLIRSQGDKFTILVQALKESNLPNVILSRLASLTTRFNRKGKSFENKIISFFRNKGYQCESKKFNIDGSQYEYDALLIIDDTIFLIECKNRTISGNHAVQAFRYAEFITETVKQVQRLEKGLRERPDIVKSVFNKDLSELKLVPLIINSLTYSRPPIEGVYISDFSAIRKFFDKEISRWVKKDDVFVKGEVMHQMWVGEHPTAKEFLEYLLSPPQINFFMKNLTYKAYPHPTSEEAVFVSGFLDIDETAVVES
ncbi:NERD domain-containing protein [Rhodospirillum rubrum]|nr:NERD domain-containing protein [Rhodospirillum rubrum]QXG79764.1 NERD domain-containing protein [Rhodospirillum rubrum]